MLQNIFKNLSRVVTERGVWPDPKWLAWANEFARHSPDLAQLEQFEWIPVFIYDDAMSMHRKRTLLEGCERFSLAFTNEKFTVYKKKLGKASFPVALRPKDYAWSEKFGGRNGLASLTQVKGELYLVRAARLNTLDNNKRNGVEYRRRKVKLIIPYREEVWIRDPRTAERVWLGRIDNGNCMIAKEMEVEAWMYIGKQSYWDNLVFQGNTFCPTKLYIKDTTIYSFFTTKELNVEVSQE